eukprot:FR735469.1.p4 GENE.FR735469.1~~FR735469.1.p4  ORF type:complete len:115 (-),score=22.18 FR735469.1:444-788(-)
MTMITPSAQLTLTKGNKSWSSTAVAAALELVDPLGSGPWLSLTAAAFFFFFFFFCMSRLTIAHRHREHQRRDLYLAPPRPLTRRPLYRRALALPLSAALRLNGSRACFQPYVAC